VVSGQWSVLSVWSVWSVVSVVSGQCGQCGQCGQWSVWSVVQWSAGTDSRYCDSWLASGGT